MIKHGTIEGMKSKYIEVKIVPTHLLDSLGFKYEINKKHWVDSWTLIDLDDIITFQFQFQFQVNTDKDYQSFIGLPEAIYWDNNTAPHSAHIKIKEYEKITPILFRRCR